MDIFVEQIVKKNFTAKDYLIFTGIVLLGILITLLAVLLLPPIAFFVLAAVCVGAYYAITSRNLEFEYSVTNGEITIDKIIYKRKRKRLFSIDAHAIEEMGEYRAEKHRERNYGKRYFATAFEDGRDSWYFTANSQKYGGHVLVVFQPDEKVMNAVKPFLSRQVARDAFGRY